MAEWLRSLIVWNSDGTVPARSLSRGRAGGQLFSRREGTFRTQPAISQTIKKLEDEIGRPLFDRSSRRGVLTDAGRVLADHAERLVNLRQRAMAALDDVRQLQDRPADDGRQRADVPVSVADPARVSAALSGSAHHGAARARQPRAGAGARLRRRLRRGHLPARHRGAATRSSSITTSSRSWCRRRIRWRGERRCRSASWRASRSSRITCRRRIGRK